MDELLNKFCHFYQQLDSSSLDRLADIYSDDVKFSDPVLTLSGLDELRAYLAHGLKGIQSCRFDITRRLCQDNEASLCWTMVLRHPKLNNNQTISVPGMSYLRLGEKIEEHRDYYDLGVMVYEHVPLLGGIVKQVKNRISFR